MALWEEDSSGSWIGWQAPIRGDVDELTQEFLAESADGLDRMERCLTELERHPGDRELVAEVFRVLHTIKGATGFLGFARLERMAHAGESLLGAVRDGRVAVTSGLVTVLLMLLDELRGVLRCVAGTGGEGQQGEAAVRRVLAELEAAGKEAPAAEVERKEPRQVNWQPEKSLRVEVEVLNRMMNLVGDLVLTRNRLLHVETGGEVAELAQQLDCVTAELRETVMRARLQPVGRVFARVPRIVRELARECRKSVRVECVGSETGLDKGLLETVKEALTHAVRNAVDHGVESADRRVAAGKPAEGVVTLRAKQGHGWVLIEVEDDGAGMHPERIRAVAVERGVCLAEQAAAMDDEEALQMIFVPGFSTAAEVTKVSGRGVGMDVVKTVAEEAGGSVEVESRVGVGTTVRLRLPLTLAIVSALVVRAAGERFCVPQQTLTELVWLESRARVDRLGEGAVYRLRDELLPVVWLGETLGLGAMAEGAGFYLAVMEGEDYRFGLAVEEIEAPEEIVVKPLSPVLREVEVFSGAAVLGCGELAMILQIGGVAARAGVAGVRRAAVPVGAVREPWPEFLVFESGRTRQRMGIALSEVDGVVQVRREEVECVEGKTFWQGPGGLVSVEDEGGLLDGGHADVTVVMQRGAAGRRQRGFTVGGALDLCEGKRCEGDDADESGWLGVVDGRVTPLTGFEQGVSA